MTLAALKGWSATQRNVVFAAYLGWTLDAFDFLMITLIAKDITATFHTPPTGIGLILTGTLALRPVGAFVFGRLADKFGRRPVLMFNVLCYSALAFASAFAPDFTTFLILRCLFGIAMGGEWGVGSSLAMEHARPETRGVVSGILQTGYPMGSLLAALAAFFLVPHFGWRALVMMSAIPALLVLFIRAAVPESSGWKQGAAKPPAIAPTGLAAGAIGVALAIAGELAITNLLNPFGIPPMFAAILILAGLLITPFAFGPRHFWLALFGMLLMAGFNSLSHGTQDLYSNFLRVQHGLDVGTASLIVACGSIGAIVGGLTAGTLSQSIGRRRMMTIGALLVLPLVPLWVFWASTPLTFAVTVFCIQFGVQGAWGVVPAHLNELSPGEARGTFPGFIYQVGNLLSSPVPYVQTLLVEQYHWVYGQSLALAAIGAAVLIAILVNLGGEGRHVVMSAPES